MPKKKEEASKPITETIEPREITTELEESYIDYAMSVIVSRALPDVRDGLKPVQRRILWAMWDDGLTHGARFRKSANVVGTVLGRYHPHGDSAVYDALARMAQDFSLRYPLVEGQGNWGSIDGDPPAAMRYTEARLTKIAEEMLKDIEKDTVDWRGNYDDTRKEPVFVPAKFPNLLLNGTMGIAVGMATSIPPHNLGEIMDGVAHLIDHPDATVQDLMQYVKGPDFPTGGIMYDPKSIEEAYTTGRGPITIRARADIEMERGAGRIIITEIPYQVVKATLIEKIAGLVQEKKIEGIKDVRDESGRDGLSIVIDLKQDVNPQRVLNFLYKHTELQKNFYFNMLALMEGIQPRVISLKDILHAYIDHRKLVIRRRTEFELNRAEERAHILEGLSIALHDIDKVIATIKKSQDRDDARKNLMSKFKLSEVQANAILDMRLQTLASLEQQKIEDELKEKKALIKDLKAILADPKKILAIIKEDVEYLKQNFADPRRTDIAGDELKEFNQEDFIPQGETVVLITQDGYIKRLPPSTFRTQGRGGRGLRGFSLKEEDQVAEIVLANTHDVLLFFTDSGKVFQTRAYDVPQAQRSAKGKLVHTFLGLGDNERITALLSYDPKETDPEAAYLVMITEGGVIKRVKLSEFQNVRSNGIIAINLHKNDLLKWVRFSEGKDEIIVATRNGQAIRFKESDVRAMGRTAAGVKAITLKKGDHVTGVGIIEKGADQKTNRLLVVTEHGYGKQTEIGKYKTQKRGGSGIKTAEITKKTGAVVAARLVDTEIEEVLAFSAKGNVIKTAISDIRLSDRATQGVRVMRLDDDDAVVGVVCL